MSEGWDDLPETDLSPTVSNVDSWRVSLAAKMRGKKLKALNSHRGGMASAAQRAHGPGPTPPRRIGGE